MKIKGVENDNLVLHFHSKRKTQGTVWERIRPGRRLPALQSRPLVAGLKVGPGGYEGPMGPLFCAWRTVMHPLAHCCGSGRPGHEDSPKEQAGGPGERVVTELAGQCRPVCWQGRLTVQRQGHT